MARRRRPHPFQPALSRTSVDVPTLVEEVRARYFPGLPGPVPAFFVSGRPLACALIASADELAFPAVYLHQVLNHPDTPIEVLRFIVKHELLHLAMPPLRRGRRVEAHPRTFWEAEQRIAPEAPIAWRWVAANLAPCIAAGRPGAGVRITRRWTRLEFAPRGPWTETPTAGAAPSPLLACPPGAPGTRPLQASRSRRLH